MRWIVVVPFLLEAASAFVPLSPHYKGVAPSLSQKSAASRGSQVSREVFGLFGGGGGGKGASEELKELLVESLRNGKALEGTDKIRADALIAELSASKVSFKPSQLGGGAWRAVYTKGPQPRWRIGSSGKASQNYDTASSTVTNSAGVIGDLVKVEAFGKYEQVDLKSSTPKDYTVTVTRGAIKVGGLSVPLGIKGEGRQRVMYVDDNLRIFQSLADTPGGWEEKDLLVVQIPEKELSLVGV